jgi:hypothetical protein
MFKWLYEFMLYHIYLILMFKGLYEFMLYDFYLICKFIDCMSLCYMIFT